MLRFQVISTLYGSEFFLFGSVGRRKDGLSARNPKYYVLRNDNFRKKGRTRHKS